MGTPGYLPCGRKFHTQCCGSWGTWWHFRSLWCLLRCYSCLLHPRQGSYDIWVHLIEDRDSTCLTRFATFLISFNTQLQPAGLCSPSPLGQVPCTSAAHPSVSEPPAFHSLFQYHLWIHSSPQTWGELNRAIFILSQVLSTVQILVNRHIQGGVGFGGCRWTAASLQFTTVGTRPQIILMMYKPLTFSISHSQSI